MGHYHRSTNDHKDKWRRRQGLTAGGVALGILWAMVAVITFTADWEVPARVLPWTQLDIDDRIGLFTRGKLNRSTGPQCRMILGNGGLSYADVPGETAGEFCSKTDAVTLSGGVRFKSPRPRPGRGRGSPPPPCAWRGPACAGAPPCGGS